MFLDPRYARVQGKENRLPAVGLGLLFTSLPDMLLCCGDNRSDRVANDALRVSVLRFRCKLLQIVPLSGEQ